jgi:hypothetical protein
MRLDHRLTVFILLLLCAACGDQRQSVVLAHTSDPHLLDGKRPAQEAINVRALATMMNTVRRGAAGTPAPDYLLITGDLGIEGTDPRYEGKPPRGGPPADDTTGAKARRAQLADGLARQINDGPFQHVLFVPGNNDVFMEDAAGTSWSGLPGFAQAVQTRLEKASRKKTFRDLTACYHPGSTSLDGCIARLDTPYVVVGFPSLSLKNALVDIEEYRKYINADTALYRGLMNTRIRRHDSLHVALLHRFGQVLGAATTGGYRKIIVLTHIPDLDDPFFVGRDMAGEPGPEGLRLTQGADAWNASPEVFRTWKRLVDDPDVLAVLAGHFHDSHRDVYYRPYSWSRSEARSDRWKTFVTPPLAIKNQDSSPIQARGFSVITLRGDSVRRRLHWYRQDSTRFEADERDEPSREEWARSADARRSWIDADPGQSAAHTIIFVAILLSALLIPMLWRDDVAAAQSRGLRWLDWRAVLAAVATTLAVLLLVQIATGFNLELWAFAAFWTLTVFGTMILLRGLVSPALREKSTRRRREAEEEAAKRKEEQDRKKAEAQEQMARQKAQDEARNKDEEETQGEQVDRPKVQENEPPEGPPLM